MDTKSHLMPHAMEATPTKNPLLFPYMDTMTQTFLLYKYKPLGFTYWLVIKWTLDLNQCYGLCASAGLLLFSQLSKLNYLKKVVQNAWMSVLI